MSECGNWGVIDKSKARGKGYTDLFLGFNGCKGRFVTDKIK